MEVNNMLSDKSLIAFIPTVKPEKALIFYRDILGLKLIRQDQFALEFDANGTPLRVTIVPELHPHNFTVLGWNVPDIASIISVLIKKGVVFERYDFMKQVPHGIWTSPSGAKVAWFKDPDGNILSLTQF
jgi:catechol 2,3-dioxygenase-like lactoylglutathione lyase family enzyme